MTQPIIEFSNVSRRYGNLTVLKNASLAISAGEVHALVGANGAGKSTLLGTLSGRVAPSSGQITVHGTPLKPGNVRSARLAGISTVYQELTILSNLTAVENVLLGAEPHRSGIVCKRESIRRYEALCDKYDVHIPHDVLAADLSVASRQQLEILRAINLSARILLLDEPTAALSRTERDVLLRQIERLKKNGTTIVIVTHNLDEVLKVSDRITIMRNGSIVETLCAAESTKQTLIEGMTGSAAAIVQSKFERRRGAEGRAPFEVKSLNVHGVVHDVSFKAHYGQVLGIAGLVGSGRSSIFRAIAGADFRIANGQIFINGSWCGLPGNVRAAQRLGIHLVPEERKVDGLVLGMSIPDNVTMSSIRRASRLGIVSKKRQLEIASGALTRWTLQRELGHYPVKELSGGGQQKVLLGKVMLAGPRVLLVDEPTRGIDVAAKAEVLASLRQIAHDENIAVIFTSAEIEEIIEVSDNILVLSGGRVMGHLDPSRDISERDVLDLCFQDEREEMVRK